MLLSNERGEQEAIQWRVMRSLEAARQDFRDFCTSAKVRATLGQPMPVMLRSDTLELIDMLIVERLVRLKNSSP
jgi:hypothetical protein